MNFFHQGGVMMWPLALVSITVLAVIIERLLLFSSFSFPGKNFSQNLSRALTDGNMQPVMDLMRRTSSLKSFVSALETPDTGHRESILGMAVAEILRSLEKRLPLLAILARLAPLLGLLGTILGMITTFSHIASSSAGINMTLLASGIWQALLTTAAGLCIAIPALLALHGFRQRVLDISDALNATANVTLSIHCADRRHD